MALVSQWPLDSSTGGAASVLGHRAGLPPSRRVPAPFQNSVVAEADPAPARELLAQAGLLRVAAAPFAMAGQACWRRSATAGPGSGKGVISRAAGPAQQPNHPRSTCQLAPRLPGVACNRLSALPRGAPPGPGKPNRFPPPPYPGPARSAAASAASSPSICRAGLSRKPWARSHARSRPAATSCVRAQCRRSQAEPAVSPRSCAAWGVPGIKALHRVSMCVARHNPAQPCGVQQALRILSTRKCGPAQLQLPAMSANRRACGSGNHYRATSSATQRTRFASRPPPAPARPRRTAPSVLRSSRSAYQVPPSSVPF